jgi:pimeloyl-ACP methyl ester carboxylesterase
MGLLSDRLDARAPDLPGFGWSPPPPDANYTPEAHARTVAKLIDDSVGEAVHLMGNSLGGAVATLVAARRPDLVRTLTLVSPALPVYRPRATNVHLPALAFPFIGQRLARRLGRYPVETRVRATLALCFADPSRVPPQRFEEAVAEASRRARLDYESEAMLASLRALIAAYLRRGPSTLWNAAAQVQAPTLLVYGLRDKLVDPKTSAKAARTFPRSHLLMLPGSGHVAQMEHPEVVAAAVRKFIDRVGSHDIDLRPVREQDLAR